MSDLVWYVSYGSNMLLSRLACYLQGGTPAGGTRRNPGARDPRMPRRSAGVELPGEVYFAGESRQWGGGVAFYDPGGQGPAYARAHLVTPGQLADIAAQEMYRQPREDDPLELAVMAGETVQFGEGRYEHLEQLGELDGRPMLTFTAPAGRHDVPLNAPSPAYAETLRQGLRECARWSEEQIETYLGRVTGSGPCPRAHYHL